MAISNIQAFTYKHSSKVVPVVMLATTGVVAAFSRAHVLAPLVSTILLSAYEYWHNNDRKHSLVTTLGVRIVLIVTPILSYQIFLQATRHIPYSAMVKNFAMLVLPATVTACVQPFIKKVGGATKDKKTREEHRLFNRFPQILLVLSQEVVVEKFLQFLALNLDMGDLLFLCLYREDLEELMAKLSSAAKERNCLSGLLLYDMGDKTEDDKHGQFYEAFKKCLQQEAFNVFPASSAFMKVVYSDQNLAKKYMKANPMAAHFLQFQIKEDAQNDDVVQFNLLYEECQCEKLLKKRVGLLQEMSSDKFERLSVLERVYFVEQILPPLNTKDNIQVLANMESGLRSRMWLFLVNTILPKPKIQQEEKAASIQQEREAAFFLGTTECIPFLDSYCSEKMLESTDSSSVIKQLVAKTIQYNPDAGLEDKYKKICGACTKKVIKEKVQVSR